MRFMAYVLASGPRLRHKWGGELSMGDFDAIGDAVTGGLLARAVEPAAGQAGDGHTHEKSCLNCGTPLTGPYCATCGQKAHVHRSLRGFFGDMVQGVFNFEGKIWRTLPMLAWRPGDLTRRYVAGERARFVSPVALYLFTVFLMFAVLNLTGALGSGEPGRIRQNFSTAVRAQQSEIAATEKQRAAAVAAGKPVASFDRAIAGQKADLVQIEKIQRGEIPVQADAGDGDDMPPWARTIVTKAQKNPELMVTNVQDAASKFSWLLIPLSVPFLWLLFPFSRRFHLYDHMVFVTYSLSFMMTLVIVGGLLVAAGASAAAGFLFFVPPFHMYRQLKGAYQLGRFGALWRTFALVTFAFLAGVLFFVLMVAIGIL
jgi:hypothetical protein